MLAIPPKRTQRRILTYLTDPEAAALLAACDQSTWTGRRDHAILTLTLQTGLRISEVAGLTRGDVTLTAGAHVHTIGKGRKERRTPLIPTTRAVLKAWLTEVGGEPGQPLFPSTTGKHLSRDAIERRLARHLVVAAAATVVSPRTSCNQISYFTDGGKNLFARRVGPVILSLIRVSLQERPDPSSVD